jgi:hypothetical protein
LNRVTAQIPGSGEYVLASTDIIPVIDNITVIPNVTSTPGASVHVSARITDDGVITKASVKLDNATEQMSLNPSTGLFEASLTGPSSSGKYQVVITATDDTDNTAIRRSSFLLDMQAPEVTILSPENLTYVTNRVNLSYYVDEVSNQSYSVDSSIEIHVNNTKPFHIVTKNLLLSGGNHSVTVFASDAFGNNASKTVDFEVAAQNIKVSRLLVPVFSRPNKSVPIRATIANTLIGNVSNVEVQLLVNGNVSGVRVLNLSGETDADVEFQLSLEQGRYNITVTSLPLPQ